MEGSTTKSSSESANVDHNGRTSNSPSSTSKKYQNVSPQRKYKNILLQVCLTILCTNFFERLTFFGVISSLAIFYTKVCVKYLNSTSCSPLIALIWTVRNWLSIACVNESCEYFLSNLPILKQVFRIPTDVSTELTALFSCVTYVSAILGAYVADRYLGRFVLFMYTCSQAVTCILACTCIIYPWRHNARHMHVPHVDLVTSLLVVKQSLWTYIPCAASKRSCCLVLSILRGRLLALWPHTLIGWDGHNLSFL